ncbi:SH3 domain-containing protein [Streptomyces sp. NPDC002537]
MADGENTETTENTEFDEGSTGDNGLSSVSVRSASAVYFPVAPGYQVNVRRGPNTGSQVVRVLPEDASVQIRCQTRGETVSGPYGTTDIWDSIAPGQYVSDAYVKTGSSDFVAVRCS